MKCANIKSLEPREFHPHPGCEVTSDNYYRLDVASLIHQLGSDGSSGLNQGEAARRLIQHGANELKLLTEFRPGAFFSANSKTY